MQRCEHVADTLRSIHTICRAASMHRDAKQTSMWLKRRAPLAPVSISGGGCHRHGQQRVYSARAHRILHQHSIGSARSLLQRRVQFISYVGVRT
jgi:hypothetical protein